MGEGSLPPAEAEALVPKFVFEKLLNQDQGGRRISLLGRMDSSPALLVLERAPFTTSSPHVSTLPQSLTQIQNIGNNDIYFWYNALTSSSPHESPPDLKVNLIYPCTPKHVRKYSPQPLHIVTETPQIYEKLVLPFVERQRGEGRLDWIYNILEGRTEQEDVLYREYSADRGRGESEIAREEEGEGAEGFLVIPDLNWDRRTILNLHVLALVERRDIRSLRDLSKRHVPWLQHMRSKIITAVAQLYAKDGVEPDQLKLYVHYQPTYYHFHVHVVHVMFEAGATQAVGKAFGLENIIGQLEGMQEGRGMRDVSLTYSLGEASELWVEVFSPLKKGELSVEDGS